MANIRNSAGIGLLILLAAACGPTPELATESTAAEHITPVRVVAVELSNAARELRLPGVVRAAQRVEPAFLVSGHLATRFVERGERVTTGQPLAGLQNPALEPSFVAAEARVRELDERLRQLGADYERARELHAQGLASAEMLDRTLAERNATREARAQAVAGVSEARDQLADAVLRAPFDGIVSDLLVEPGDFVPAGRPVLVLAGDSGLEVEVHLPEGLARRLSPGEVVEVRAVQSGARIAGLIREVGLAREGRPAPAIIALGETDAWEPGISVHVALTHAEEAALTVPVSAIVDPGTGQTRLFKIADDRAVAVPVTVGRLIGARVTIQGEIVAGDRVVVAGHQQLLDGEAVRVLP